MLHVQVEKQATTGITEFKTIQINQQIMLDS